MLQCNMLLSPSTNVCVMHTIRTVVHDLCFAWPEALLNLAKVFMVIWVRISVCMGVVPLVLFFHLARWLMFSFTFLSRFCRDICMSIHMYAAPTVNAFIWEFLNFNEYIWNVKVSYCRKMLRNLRFCNSRIL